jgi:hypothetical protein
VNSDSKSADPKNDSAQHERARLLIVLSAAEALSDPELTDTEQSWLSAHLEFCSSCRDFQENSRETIRSLRAIPISGSGRLVSATQMRVRRRAQELQREQEHFWVICTCVAAVTLSSAVSAAAVWHGFEWIGQQARLSAPAWESGFVVFYLMPAVLAGILLLARGTFLADDTGRHQD